MPSPTNDLISRLVEDVESTTPMQKPLNDFFIGLAASLFFLIILSILLGIRPDIIQKFTETTYLLELLFSFITAIVAGIATMWLALPDVRQQSWIRWAPFIPLAALVIVNLKIYYSADWQWSSQESGLNSGIACATHFFLYAIVPGAVYFFLLKRGASTKCCWAGSTALLSVSSMAYFSLRIIEPADHIIHILYWHWIPLFLIPLAGMMAGKVLLRW